MIWVTWRQCRTTIVSTLSVIALLVLVAIGAGFQVRGTGADAFGGFCSGYNSNQDCVPETALTITTLITAALPVLLGIMVGVTVFSRDIDRGTHVLGLTQSVSRTRWYSMRVLVVFGPITAAMTVLGVVLRWTRDNPAGSMFYSEFGFPIFDTSGIVPGAYTFLALMIGSTAALFLRNTIASVVLTLIVMVAILIALPNGIRQQYASPDIEVQSIDDQDLRGLELGGSVQGRFSSYLSIAEPTWVLGTDLVDARGTVVNVDYSLCPSYQDSTDLEPMPDETTDQYDSRIQASAAVQRKILADCVRAQGADHIAVRYHPQSRYWPFQLAESGLMLMLAAGVRLLAGVRLRRL